MEKLIKNMAKAILSYLGKIVKLPSVGHVAGGAVANCIVAILDGNIKNALINDVDVFLDTGAREACSMKTNGMTPERDMLVGETQKYDSYKHILVQQPIYQMTYKVISTLRFDMLNQIECGVLREDGSYPMTTKELISSFDLNNTGAGIDLCTGKLYVTDDFLEFLRTRVLRISTLWTPYHSVIRYFKKLNTLDHVTGGMTTEDFRQIFFNADMSIVAKSGFGQRPAVEFGLKYLKDADKYLPRDQFYTLGTEAGDLYTLMMRPPKEKYPDDGYVF